MELKKISLFFVSLLLLAGFTSCNDDDDDDGLVLSTSSTTISPIGSASIQIISGRGGYSVKSDNEEVATATIDGDVVVITGRALGTAVVTVTDQKNDVATIQVNVEVGVLILELFEYKFVVEASDLQVKEMIESEIKQDLPLPIGTRYRLAYEDPNGGILTVSPKEGEDISGTFYDEKVEGTSMIFLSYNNQEFAYIWAAIDKQLGFVEEMTQACQELYPDAGITKVGRGQKFIWVY